MKPDGLGTDSYEPQGAKRQRSRSTNSVERDTAKLALVFVLIGMIVCGGVWLSQRQYLPPPSDSDPTAQQSP